MRVLLSTLTGVALCLSAAGARADDIKVLTTGAFRQVVVAMVPVFEQRTGHKVTVENDTAGGLAKKIDAGAMFDVVVLTPSLIKDLVAKDKVAANSVANLARVGVGVMVPAGAPMPAIGTVEEFKKTLLDAKNVAYIDPASGGSSGIYLAQLFKEWGIADQIAPKAVLVFGGYVADRLVKGDATLGIHQISEIVPVKGVTLVGPLPASIQNYTTYTGAAAKTSQHAAAAQAFLDLLTGPETAMLKKEKGMESVGKN